MNPPLCCCRLFQAHFDCVPPHFTVIDGARSKWCYLLLLNAVVGILDFDSFNLAARRKFNQQQVLCDCIKAELADNGIPEDLYENTTLAATMDSNWCDLKILRNFLERNAPYKSKEKYLGILDILLNHKVIEKQGFDISKCINMAINKIISCANKRPSRRQVVVAPALKSKRVMSMKPSQATSSAATSRESAPRKIQKLATPTKKRVNAQPDEIPQPTKRRSRRNFPESPTVSKPPPVRTTFPRHASFPSVPAKAYRETRREVSNRFAFNSDDIFNEHEDEIDPNEQPWELLDMAPESKNPSPHFHRSASAIQLGTASGARSFGSPFFTGAAGLGDPFAGPSSLSLMTPDACKLMLPFPDTESQHLLSMRMNPFPIEEVDGAGRDSLDQLDVEEQHFGSDCYDDSSC